MGLPPFQEQSLASPLFKAFLMVPIRLIAKYLITHHQNLITDLCERWYFFKKFARKSESLLETSLTSNEVRLYNRKAIYSTRKTQKILGFTPKFDLDRGLQLTAAWLQHNGYTKR